MTQRHVAPLQARIAGAVLAISTAVLLLACLLFLGEQWRADTLQVRTDQAALAHVLAQQAAPALQDRGQGLRLLSALDASPGVRQAFLLGADGRTLVEYRRAVALAGQGWGAPVETRAPIRLDGVTIGQVLLRADATHIVSRAPLYLSVGLALVFASTGVALLLGRALALRVTEPIDALVAAMRDAAVSGDLKVRVRRRTDDEVGRLTDSFNALLSRLEANDDELRSTMRELVAARDAAQAANLMKSQFLANISHEIRTPLNGVLATVQILALSDLTATQREHLELVRESAEALQALLNDVLDVSKIEAGQLTLETSAFDPAAIARSAIGVFAAAAQQKGVKLTLDCAPGLVPRRGDEARLRQILVNLVSNAVKFTGQGSVRIEIGDAPEAQGGALEIGVLDTGIGLAPEIMPRLFDKFVQGDASITRKFGGTGLGLAICHDLAELMGGRIWGEARASGGAAFRVVLPLARVEESATAPAPSFPALELPAPVEPSVDRVRAIEGARTGKTQPGVRAPSRTPGERLRVLAAEDNATNQRVLATVLELFGMDLHVVPDGAKAVEAWASQPFDVVLMDIQMPVMDGVAATRAIRAAEREGGLGRIPIIALSANAMTHQVSEYIDAGMDMHVAKPIELARLRDALDAATRVAAAAA